MAVLSATRSKSRYVLPGLVNDAGVVGAAGPFVPGDHGAGAEGLYSVEGGDPLPSLFGRGLCQVEVDVVVGSVAGHDQPDVRDMETGGVVGVGMAELDDDHVVALEVQYGAGECFGDDEMFWDLAREALLPEGRHHLR